jgi:tRNA1(Val) A37 N6-methylase TrmN6
VPASAGDSVLDIGCGAGAAMLCLAARVPCRVTGIEPQRDLVRLAGDNIVLNDLSGRVVVMTGDLLRPPPRLEPGSVAHVMANPPFLEAGAATASPNPSKAAAMLEGEADLAAWVRFALAMVRPKGSLTFIHRADRMERLLAQLAGRAGEIVVFPLWAGPDKPAKRIIVRARKDVATPTRLTAGMTLHESDGRYTPAADAILRGGAALTF